MITFRDVLKARVLGDSTKLTEASLGRVYQHYKKSGEKSWGIVSAYRGNLSPNENKTRSKGLEALLRGHDLGFFKLFGFWRECRMPGVNYKDCPEDQLSDAKPEIALFVPGIKREVALALCKKYDQDAVIYAGPETDGNVTLLFPNGSSQKIGAFHPRKIAQAYSKLKGSTFVFEHFDLRPSGFAESLIEKQFMAEFEKYGLNYVLEDKGIEKPDTLRESKVEK